MLWHEGGGLWPAVKAQVQRWVIVKARGAGNKDKGEGNKTR